MRKLLVIGLALLGLASCSSFNNGELIGVEKKIWHEPNPYGMVLINQSTFELGQSEEDTLFGLTTPSKYVSVGSFWMDETEITNGQYKTFIQWVCDSIIRVKLADPNYGGNEDYMITENANGEAIAPTLNWKIPIPSAKRATEEELTALHYFYKKDDVKGGYYTNTDLILYKYEWFDEVAAAKRENQLVLAKRNLNTDLNPAQLPQVMITKDTAYLTEDGKVVRQSITRPLQSRSDFLNTYIIAIYPDTTCWVNDFSNSYNTPYLLNYFSHPSYNAYPVVGVSWEQATAFCHWRTERLNEALKVKGQKVMEYRLPTEAEWEMAARADQKSGRFPWLGSSARSDKGCFYANFKPTEGGYTIDGHIIATKVATYPANEFGLYDMAGNVAEWTSTNWSESGYEVMSDLNPSLDSRINTADYYINKRKVIRGGSWKDAARFIEVSTRTYEYSNESHSYVGFRCVRSQIGESKNR